MVDVEGVGEGAVLFAGFFDGDGFDDRALGDAECAAEEGVVGVVDGVEDAGRFLFGDADVAIGEVVEIDHGPLVVAVADEVDGLLFLGGFEPAGAEALTAAVDAAGAENGRASCRERV